MSATSDEMARVRSEVAVLHAELVRYGLVAWTFAWVCRCASTDVTDLQKQVRWNQAYYRLAGGL